jgi:hypothetical protein
MNTVLVLGAGVDKTEGINMPLANGLMPEIARYSEGNGKAVNDVVRSFLPSLRFSFVKFINEAIDEMTKLDSKNLLNLYTQVEAIKERTEGKESKIAEVICQLLKKVSSLKDETTIDDETFQLIKEAFDDKFLDELQDESIIQISKLSFSDTFKGIMQRVLKDSLKNPNSEINRVLSRSLLDMETLLIDTFLGFYNRNVGEIKRYLYISWLLWAYLVDKELEIYNNYAGNPLPFYSTIPTHFKVITLNYTSFVSKYISKENIIYFHGNLKQYLRMDNRDLIDIDRDNLQPLAFLAEEIACNIDIESQRFIIPAIIPPLKIKPVLSNKNISAWYNALCWLQNCERIIVCGYSFNYADEHFNDMIRQNADKDLVIIDPNATLIKRQICSLFGYTESSFTKYKYQGKHEGYVFKNIRIIGAKADEIALGDL